MFEIDVWLSTDTCVTCVVFLFLGNVYGFDSALLVRIWLAKSIPVGKSMEVGSAS